MMTFVRKRMRLAFMAGDLLAILFADTLAVLLRFDFDWQAMTPKGYWNVHLLLVDLALTPVIFRYSGLYEGYWRYAGLSDLFRLARAVGARMVTVIVVCYVLGFYGVSRAVVIISTVLLLLLAGLLRLAPRFRVEILSLRRRDAGRRTLIVGAGDTGESLLRELSKGPHLGFNPVGFVDDDPEKRGVRIHGVPVLGGREAIAELLQEHGIQEVIIAVPTASGRDMREIFEVCRRAGCPLRTVPTRGELERGAARVGQIRRVDLEDLLGREVVDLDIGLLRQAFSGRRVLVTGAAGSIGRELARQIASYEPQELTLLDRNENNLFSLEAEIRDRHPLQRLRFEVVDILDPRRVDDLFRETRPEIVFHAAAYKHVPLMEIHPTEAIKNNVTGTRRVAEAALRHHAGQFIYISTDKAVRPTSVMGATKRLGERLVRSLGGGTRFMAVRFGNVLGSDGSVVPTFRRQISAGGPLTVTHPEVERFFMTIPEAVQLVLTAGVMGQGGETFLLRMGEPVRILDVARSMIELSGLRPDRDIPIVFTGLRPGEKLREELQAESEQAMPTSNEKIMVLSGTGLLDHEGWARLRDLEAAALDGRAEEAIALLRLMVEDYTPSEVAARWLTGSPAAIVDLNLRRRQEHPA